MVRVLIATGIQILANALGLFAAAIALEGMEVSGTAFIIAVLIFTAVYAIAQPFLAQMADSRVPALRGGVALVATLVGLIVTAAVSDGLSVSGLPTWVTAAVIVWVVSLLGVLILPVLLLRRATSGEHNRVQEDRSPRRSSVEKDSQDGSGDSPTSANP